MRYGAVRAKDAVQRGRARFTDLGTGKKLASGFGSVDCCVFPSLAIRYST